MALTGVAIDSPIASSFFLHFFSFLFLLNGCLSAATVILAPAVPTSRELVCLLKVCVLWRFSLEAEIHSISDSGWRSSVVFHPVLLLSGGRAVVFPNWGSGTCKRILKTCRDTGKTDF